MATALSKADICNLALDYLLQTNEEVVTNIEAPSTPTEVVCNRWYDVTRRAVLREHPWLFARKRITLTPTTTTPAFGYSNAYNLPNDFIRLVSIEDPNSFNPFPNRLYTIEGRQILTNPVEDSSNGTSTDSLNIIYIYNLTNVAQVDSLFVEVLAAKLALNMSYKFTSSNSDVQRIEALLRDKLQSARSINGQERPPLRIERSRAHLARRQLGDNQTTRINPWY
jgi:hypothetical protein